MPILSGFAARVHIKKQGNPYHDASGRFSSQDHAASGVGGIKPASGTEKEFNALIEAGKEMLHASLKPTQGGRFYEGSGDREKNAKFVAAMTAYIRAGGSREHVASQGKVMQAVRQQVLHEKVWGTSKKEDPKYTELLKKPGKKLRGGQTSPMNVEAINASLTAANS